MLLYYWVTLTLSLLARNVICSADQNSILANFVYHTTINSVRSWKLYFVQITTSNTPPESYFYRILMVLTPSRYLNWIRSYSFLNIDMSKFFTNINHGDVGCHDSTVQYILCHDSSKLVNDR